MSRFEPKQRAVFHALAHLADASGDEVERDVSLSTLAISLGVDACAILARDRLGWQMLATSHRLGVLRDASLTDSAVLKEVRSGSTEVRFTAAETHADPLIAAIGASGFANGFIVSRGQIDNARTVLLGCHEASTAARLDEASLAIFRTALAIASSWPRRERALPAGEAAVLDAFARGLTPQDIAAERGTSVRTIRNQLESARVRLDAKTKAHAVAVAVARGLLAQ